MSSLQNKIDFVALVSVTHANSNGDPLNGNRPRTDLNGFGEISDVCIKRKIRNRMQDLGEPIFVQSEDRCSDGCGSLSERASAAMKGIKDREEYARHACGVRGPVSIHQASSLSPVEIESLQITKSVNGEKKEKGENRASDTMGMKHFVRFGLYEVKGSINVQLAEKTGFSEEDADTVKECLRTLFVNDASSARQGRAVFLRKGPPLRQGRAAGRRYHPHLRRRLCDLAGGAAGAGAGGDRWRIARRTSYSSPAYSISGFAGGGGR